MSGKSKNTIGFKQNYQIEAELREKENKEENEENKDFLEKQKAALEAIAGLAGQSQMSTNEILLASKIQMYSEIVKSSEFATKLPEEKEAFLAELLWLQSLTTEMSVLKFQMQSVINK